MGVCALALAAWFALNAGASCGARLEYVGTLGRRADTPAPFLAARGIVQMPSGNLWTGAGRVLYEYAPAGEDSWRLVRSPTLPASLATDNAIQTDGASVVFAGCDDGWIYRIDAVLASSPPERWMSIPAGSRAFVVVPPDQHKGLAATAPVFALRKNAVVACDATEQKTALTLPDVHGGYQTLGIEPQTGDLLIASSYPDMRVYRYGPGGQVLTGGWPRAGYVLGIHDIRGVAWALRAGGGAFSMPGALDSRGFDRFDTQFASFPFGLCAASDGGFWIASMQGVSHLDAWGRTDGERLGGLPGVSHVAVVGDGMVVAVVEDARRYVCLHIDDSAGDVLSSNGNEPWTTAGKGDQTAAITSCGKDCVVVDRTQRKLFLFRPTHEQAEDKPWMELATAAPLDDPTGVAGGDTRLWVLDSGRILEAGIEPTLSFHDVVLPGIPSADAPRLIAASPDENSLFVARAGFVSAFRRGSDGSYVRLWQTPLSGAISMAASGDTLFVSAKDARSVACLDVAHGRLAEAGLQVAPTAIAYHNGFLVVADSEGSRLLVYRVLP